MSQNLKLTEMLCARFTHDIIGPVGALSNGAEFLREELGSKPSIAADLIESSSREAVARVQYYRQAYGYSPANAPTSMDDVKELVQNYFAASKIKLQWEKVPQGIQAGEKKLLLNLLIVAAGCLIRGGIISIKIDGNYTITAEGPKASLHENSRKTLLGGTSEEEIDARLVQIYYTYMVGKETSAKIEISENPEQVIFSFRI